MKLRQFFCRRFYKICLSFKLEIRKILKLIKPGHLGKILSSIKGAKTTRNGSSIEFLRVFEKLQKLQKLHFFKDFFLKTFVLNEIKLVLIFWAE